jgi:hypothetical protein
MSDEWVYSAENVITGVKVEIKVERLLTRLANMFPDDLQEFLVIERLPPDPELSRRVVRASASILVESNFTPTVFTRPSLNFEQKVQITVFNENGPAHHATPDHTQDHIQINSPGIYEIHGAISFSGGLTDRISFALFKNNGAIQLGTRNTRQLGGGGDVGAMPISARTELIERDTIELWAQNETGVNSVVIEDCRLAIDKV